MEMLDIDKFANPAIENIVDRWAEWDVEGQQLAQCHQNDIAWLWLMRQKVGELVKQACKEAAGINFQTVEHFTRTIEAADVYIRCLRQMVYASEQSVIDEAFKNADSYGSKWHRLRNQCDIPPLD